MLGKRRLFVDEVSSKRSIMSESAQTTGKDAKKPVVKNIGAYEITAVIDEGERSAIYIAEHETHGKCWLIALPRTIDHEVVLAFKRRIETLTFLDHPRIPEILDYRVRKNSHAFAAIRYSPLTDLKTEYKLGTPEAEPLSAITALNLIKQIAELLSILHPTGLVHTNLIPERIFLDAEKKPVFLDAAVPFIPLEEQAETNNTTFLPYESPEERARKPIAARSNIYSLGVILYELLAGGQPRLPVSDWVIFDYKALPREVPLEQVRDGLMEETYDLVRSCLWQKEWSRYDTVEMLIAATEIAIASEEQGRPAPTLLEHYRLYFLIGVPAVILILIGLLLTILLS
jgi:serine/threonine protein kinase